MQRGEVVDPAVEVGEGGLERGVGVVPRRVGDRPVQPGQVRVEGVGSESVEISARRYARGSDPAAARENASGVAVDVAREGATVEISSDGGRGTGVDYALRVPRGSRIEVESAAGDVTVEGTVYALTWGSTYL